MKRSRRKQRPHFVKKLKQLFVSIAMVLTFVVYAVHEHLSSTEIANPIGTPVDNLVTLVPQSTPQSNLFTQAQTILPQPTPTTTLSKFIDGQYTGQIANAFYGYVQVEIVIQNGSITDVQFTQSPNHSRTSQRINSIAMPYLRSEAIQAQRARVNIISGATLTSRAFMVSLQSALNQAERNL